MRRRADASRGDAHAQPPCLLVALALASSHAARCLCVPAAQMQPSASEAITVSVDSWTVQSRYLAHSFNECVIYMHTSCSLFPCVLVLACMKGNAPWSTPDWLEPPSVTRHCPTSLLQKSTVGVAFTDTIHRGSE
jgi:hypothetical protein